MKLIGFFSGIIGTIVLVVVYFGVFTPTGLFLRLFGRDFLQLNLSKKSSYWISRRKFNKSDFFKRQF